ncbi:DUF6633 family protein [Bacteroides sp. 51]|uniref:DUF6633 family protein n=1 Tax=Bacteroides sp. 51 TaxID=2302938 RepID=UPI0013D2D82C|nr:DUF6633 family protein [Bacteroides sp. 51]NDV81353.1 hypothetical protein [Bacteroides sp. 51]
MLYWDSIRPKTVLDVFKSPQVSIVELKTQNGEIWLQALMVKWMNSFLRFYSVNGTMNAIQVADTINLIIETYPHYTQEDFKLFFNMAKKGLFGQIFGRVDGEVIMSWLTKYDIHRDTKAQDLSIKEAEVWKKLHPAEATKGVFFHEYMEIKKRADAGDLEAIELLKPPRL